MVVALESRTSFETVDERTVERQRGDHRAPDSPWADEVDLPLRSHRIAPPDAESAGSLDGQVRPPLEHALQRRPVTSHERALEHRVARKCRRAVSRRGELLLVGGKGGAQPGLQARIHPPCLASRRDGRKTPEGGRQGKQREQQEVGDELDFETSHGVPSSSLPPLPIHPLNEVSTKSGET